MSPDFGLWVHSPQGYLLCYCQKGWRSNPSASAGVLPRERRQAPGWNSQSLLLLSPSKTLFGQDLTFMPSRTNIGSSFGETPIESQSPICFPPLLTPAGFLLCPHLHVHHGIGCFHSWGAHNDCPKPTNGRERQGHKCNQFYLIYLNICSSALGYSHLLAPQTYSSKQLSISPELSPSSLYVRLVCCFFWGWGSVLLQGP